MKGLVSTIDIRHQYYTNETYLKGQISLLKTQLSGNRGYKKLDGNLPLGGGTGR